MTTPRGRHPSPGRVGRSSHTSDLSPPKNPQPRREPLTVGWAAEHGSYRDLLVAMRDVIARQIDGGVSPRDLVGLSRRLRDLAMEIHDLNEAQAPHLRVVDEPWDPEAI